MAKTVTLRLNDSVFQKFKSYAEMDNRSLSNFIETATLRYIENVELVDEFEMNAILEDETLIRKLKKGSKDAKNREGRFVWTAIEYLKPINLLRISTK